MRLEKVFVIPSPLGQKRQRLCAEVSYETGVVKSEIYWFDVPEQCGSQLSLTGNAWLALLLPLAMTVGEPLDITLPVDRDLYRSTDELMAIWRSWHGHLRRVAVHCDRVEPITSGGQRCASFFSGGVDSMFTVLKQYEPGIDLDDVERIDDLVLVWGFDIPLKHAEAFSRLRDRCAKVAAALDRPLIDIATNVRETQWGLAAWGDHSHGSALAAVGLILEARWRRICLSSTHSYSNLDPWGSHPLTDCLHSTRSTLVVHEGAAFDRVEKTRFLARSELALQNLHVCWSESNDRNCSRCNKCYRTMITLDLLGAAGRATTFDWTAYDLARVRTNISKVTSDRQLMAEVQRLADELGRTDVSRAIAASLRRSSRIVRWRAWMRPVLVHTRPMNRRIAALTHGRPVLWRISLVLRDMRVT